MTSANGLWGARATKPLLSLVISLAVAAHAAAGEVSVTDGDGLRIGGERIRLWGIDAPELVVEIQRKIPDAGLGNGTPHNSSKA